MGPYYPPLPTWAYHQLLDLDFKNPGILGHVARASAVQRQIALAVLAGVHHDEVPVQPCPDEVVALIRAARPRDAIAAVYGRCPDGYLGALGKVSRPVNQRPTFYPALYGVFTDPTRRSEARLIAQLSWISETRLRIIAAVDPVFHSPAWLDRIDSVAAAKDLSTALDVIQHYASGVTRDALLQSARNWKGTRAAFVQRWVRCIDRMPPPPVDVGPNFRPLRTAEEMVSTGRRYRNCLSSSFEILQVLAGRSFHYVDQSRGLIVTLQAAGYRRCSAVWVVSTILGPDNTPPSPRAQRDILGDLNRYGIGREGDREPDPEPIAVLRRGASSLDGPTIEGIIAEMEGFESENMDADTATRS